MSSVHFKFRSSLKFESIQFNGHNITVRDLKDEIVKAKKFDKFMEDYDLSIMNDQTNEEYKPDDFVQKNSSVIVARIPITKSRRDILKRAAASPIQVENESTLECISRMTDVASMNLSEEDKLTTVMDQGNKEFDSINYSKTKKFPRGPVPKNYICHRCGLPGHFIQKCPRVRDVNSTEPFPKLKRSTGIPNSFMTTVDDINTPGVLLTSSGRLAVPIIDAEAYRIGKTEKLPFIKPDPIEKEKKVEMPKELTCPVCKELLSDAVVLPCCGNSTCDSCVMSQILESVTPKCPVCHKTGVSALDVIPNKSMRTAVDNYRNETGYTTTARNITPIIPTIKSEPSVEDKAATVVQSSGIKTEAMNEEKMVPMKVETVAPAVESSQAFAPETIPIATGTGEPVPISGMKGAKMVRVLVARPGAQLSDQSMSTAPYSQLSAMNMYSLPPPPLPQNYHHSVIAQPGLIPQGPSALPMNQVRNNHVLIYTGAVPPARVIGPPPPLVPMGSGGPMPMNFSSRMPGSLPIVMSIPGVPPMPMTEEEFYREKERLRQMERKRHVDDSLSPSSPRRGPRPPRKNDLFEFAEDIMYKKQRHIKRRSRSRSFVRSRSRSRTRRSSSFTTKSSPSLRGRMRRSRSRLRNFKNSRSRSRKSRSLNRSPSPRREAHPKPFEMSRRSDSLGRSRNRRSPSLVRKEARYSKSPVRSSRSNSSRRSFVRNYSRSRSPMKKWSREKELSAGRKAAPKRKLDKSISPEPSSKRQRNSPGEGGPQRDAYASYEKARRSPSRHVQVHHSQAHNPDRPGDRNDASLEEYYKKYKDWCDFDRERRNAARNLHRGRDLSRSPSRGRRRRRAHSRDSQSMSRGESPHSYRGAGRREDRDREVWREPPASRERRGYGKQDGRERMERRDGRGYCYDDYRPDDKGFSKGGRAPQAEGRRDGRKDSREREDRQKRRDAEKRDLKSYATKDIPKVDVNSETEPKSSKVCELMSPPKSKVHIINPRESVHVREKSSATESTSATKETSVRIVTKDTCKTMKITVSSKWDSDKEGDKQEKLAGKRLEKEKSQAILSQSEDTSFEKAATGDDGEKMGKHKKKHKKEKKKHAKKHKSKGPE